jgi:hypothetical protein
MFILFRDEDRTLLETCKAKGPSSATFASIADDLESKTTAQVSIELWHLNWNADFFSASGPSPIQSPHGDVCRNGGG